MVESREFSINIPDDVLERASRDAMTMELIADCQNLLVAIFADNDQVNIKRIPKTSETGMRFLVTAGTKAEGEFIHVERLYSYDVLSAVLSSLVSSDKESEKERLKELLVNLQDGELLTISRS